ncbi:DUF167 family protein [Candidatus Tisiphia endosymbiont of Ptychoptera albimana]|uniref:A1G_07140 family DUF167 domain protein n=1 Tax=Candidatus Tisiphia endosymbiont of Ptychoptera albimana TaxID=3066260 RepID=UPI00312CB954
MSKISNYNPNKKLAILALKVKANAKTDKIGEFIIINDKYYLKLSIKAVPKDGKANDAIVNFLSKEWKICKNNFEIILGHTNILKLLAIKNIELDYLNLHLKHYIHKIEV